jgi:hypothetical protein
VTLDLSDKEVVLSLSMSRIKGLNTCSLKVEYAAADRQAKNAMQTKVATFLVPVKLAKQLQEELGRALAEKV